MMQRLFFLTLLAFSSSTLLFGQGLDRSIERAFQSCNANALSELCNSYQFLESKDSKGRYPIHLAAYYGCDELMKIIVANQPEKEVPKGELGHGILFYLSDISFTAKGKADWITHFIKSGENPNERDTMGITVLQHFFASAEKMYQSPDEFEKIFLALTDNGADPLLADFTGNTALLYYHRNVRKDFPGVKGIYMSLFKAGCSPETEQLAGKSLLERAREKPTTAPHRALLESWDTWKKQQTQGNEK